MCRESTLVFDTDLKVSKINKNAAEKCQSSDRNIKHVHNMCSYTDVGDFGEFRH